MQFSKHYIVIFIIGTGMLTCSGMLRAQPGLPETNRRQLTLTKKALSWTLPDPGIIPATLRIAASGRLLADSLYALEGRTLSWRGDTALLDMPLEVSYRVFPAWLSAMRFRLDSALMDTSARSGQVLGYRYNPYSDPNPLINFQKVGYSGSFSRGISVGNRQDLVLNSSFNLQLSGDLGDGLEIRAAISDENLPLQPEGTSLQLREFDRVFIQLARKDAQLTAGDYDLRPEGGGYFLQYFNRLQGAAFRQKQGAWQYQGAAAVARGKFTRYNLPQEEGNQGPYPLRGNAGERFIVVLAGTEKVFLNGQLLQRGFDNDYIIDYNRGEITFMPRRLITRESRIAVEYEYADQNFLRSVFAAQTTYQQKNFRAYTQFYSRQDSRNPSANLTLNDADKRILQAAGDDPAKAFISGIQQQESFSPARVFYALRDTLTPCGQADSILVYSTDPAEARFTARFTFLGPGKGNYVTDEQQGANERVFRWVAPHPVTCQPMGAYEPVLSIAPPQQQQMITLGQEWAPDASVSLRTELAISRLDLNRLSPVDAQDDWGWAAYSDFRKRFQLSADTGGWNLQTRLSLEVLNTGFQPINPYRNPEFLRDWSLADFQGVGATEAAREFLTLLETRLERSGFGHIAYAFQSFLRGDSYRGAQHQAGWDLRPERWQIQGQFRLNQAEQERENSRFWRPALNISRMLSRWRLSAGADGELNRRTLPASDSLLGSSFAFYQIQFALESPEQETWHWQAQHKQRRDYLPLNGAWLDAISIEEWNMAGRWQKKQNVRLQANLNYRRLRAGSLSEERSGNTLLGRLDAGLQALRGAVRSNTVYELGSGQEPRLEFTFIKVAPGEGAYIWQDSLYNNDGVIQAYEMEPAPFPDQADYIRVSTISTEFIRTNFANLTQSLQLEPRAYWRTPETSFTRLMSKISAQLSWRIQHKTQADERAAWANPLGWQLEDTALVALNAGLRQLLIFNRAHPKWEVQALRNQNRSKQVQTTGFEIRSLEEYALQLRWNWSRQWTLRPALTLGERNSDSERFNARDYRIAFTRAEAQLSWLPVTQLRFQANYRFQRDRNSLPGDPVRAASHDLSLESTYNPAGNTSLQLRLSNVQVQYDGNPRTPVGFAILNGLQAGSNWLWNLSLDRQLARSLQLRFSYEGRKTGGNPVVHVGRAQLTAVF